MQGNRYLSVCAALWALRKRANYLRERGWFDSVRLSMPVDRRGRPVPWYAYAAADFLAERVHEEMRVFEYGSGNSTLWWANRVATVVSCEHDQQWFLNMKPRLPANVTYMHVDLEPAGNYSTVIRQYAKAFDIIVIDGRERAACAMNSLGALNDTGVIIWDDSRRDRYRNGCEFLIGQGFRRLDFTGFGPINAYGMCTSVFYRKNNCLDI